MRGLNLEWRALQFEIRQLFLRPVTPTLARPVFFGRASLLPLLALVLLAVPSSAYSAPPTQTPPADIQIPAQADWTDRGVVLAPGPPGSWDVRLSGAISPSTVVLKDGTYYLYYIGADGDRSTDGGPRNRALGVATSADGITFQKYSGNPILTHLPHNNQEEGIFSAGATLDENGDVVLYYGALWASDSQTASVDIYIGLAVSADGLNFEDRGYVRVASGKEETPVGVFRANGAWSVYFIDTKGWQLRLLTGATPETVANPVTLIDTGGEVRGGIDPVWLAPDQLVLFIDRISATRFVEVRTVSPSTPQQLSAPVQTYNFSGLKQPTVLLNPLTNTWSMFYRTGATIGVKTAPVVGGDSTPPAAPTGLLAAGMSESQIDLTWSSASDPDSGVSGYNIYRDGVKVATLTTTSFSDIGLAQATTYSYEVSAVNGAGLEGPRSAAVPATTFADNTPPALLSARALDATLVEVEFSEPVDSASASLLSNYAITGSDGSSVAVSGTSDPVTNAAAGKAVLTTDTHVDRVTYTLTVSGVTDLAGNTISSPSSASYVFVAALIITGTSPTQYVWDVIEVGAVQYIDRTFTFNTVPEAYLGLSYLKTANDDKGTTGDPLVSFDVNQDVSVYVAHDDRITPKPGWLASFADTGDNLESRGGSFSLLVKDFPAGTVALGDNEGDGFSMYTVVVRGQGSGGATVVMSAGPDTTINEDDTFSGTGYFAGPQGTWTGTVDYGDGSGPLPLTLASNSFTLSHIYSTAGLYTVTVTITDGAAITASDSVQVQVIKTFPTLPGMTSPAQDLDGDGRAEDTNGNGRLDFADVVILFEHLDSAEVQDHQADFDFNGNGSVDMDDIVQLFALVTA